MSPRFVRKPGFETEVDRRADGFVGTTLIDTAITADLSRITASNGIVSTVLPGAMADAYADQVKSRAYEAWAYDPKDLVFVVFDLYGGVNEAATEFIAEQVNQHIQQLPLGPIRARLSYIGQRYIWEGASIAIIQGAAFELHKIHVGVPKTAAAQAAR